VYDAVSLFQEVHGIFILRVATVDCSALLDGLVKVKFYVKVLVITMFV
jgi:hypothetical protein